MEIILHIGGAFGHDQTLDQGLHSVKDIWVNIPLYPSKVYWTKPGYGSVASGNSLVRTRMLGDVGAGGEIPPATRLVVNC